MTTTKPPLTGNHHRLNFDALSPQKFEELCLWLVRREGYERAEYLGEAGGEQGRDVLAFKDGRRVVFQCKRVAAFGLAAAKKEMAKQRALPAAEQPNSLVFVVSKAVSAEQRTEIRKEWGAADTCDFWAGAELDERVKRHPEIVREFFQLASDDTLAAEAKRPRWLDWGLALSAIGLIATLAAWFWPSFWSGPATPAIYAVRVQVLDPEGRPLLDSRVRTSAGHEPQALPDGWWEIEVPAAKLPATRTVTFWAEHADWAQSSAEVVLDHDPNPTLAIRLKAPSSWLRGRVLDAAGAVLPGIRVSPADGMAAEATTGTDGRFELRLPLPADRRVRIRAEQKSRPAIEVYCYSGRDSCQIVLEDGP